MTGSTQEDYFFNDARPGLARFSPDIVIQKHRDIITNIASRSGLPLRQGVFAIDDHAILITADQAREFITLWKELRSADNPTGHDKAHPWLIPQSILHLAYPSIKAPEIPFNANIVADAFGLDDFHALMCAAPDVSKALTALFSATDTRRISYLHNLCSMLAYSLAEREPGKAALLFRKLAETSVKRHAKLTPIEG